VLIEYLDGDTVLVRGILYFEEERDLGYSSVVWGRVMFGDRLIHKFTVLSVLRIIPTEDIPENVLFIRTDKNGDTIQFLLLS
jgi:hypothetical protein